MNDLGSASIESPSPAIAGAYATVVYTYTVGHPIDDTGYLRIAFRFASDCGQPQFEDKKAPNYCTVETDGDCRIETRWDIKGNIRPWGRVLVLKVMGGYLDRGEHVTVVYGDTSGGSPGWQLQTFCEDTFEFKTLVDPYATYQFREIERSPTLSIVSGPAARTVIIAPSQVVKGEPFEYLEKQEDRWGNPCGAPQRRKYAGFDEIGIHFVRTSDNRAISNPIQVTQSLPPSKRYWADLHGQSEETIGTNTIEDYFNFAREKAGLDLAAHQGNDFQMSDAFWDRLNQVTSAFNDPGRFVTFPGYEWSGNTALGGDRNVFFTTEGGPILRSSLELVPGNKSEWPVCETSDALFDALRKVKQPKPFVFAHVGGRYADISSHDADLEWAIEVHSAWGTFEWMLHEAFDRGYRVGVCANSDGHKGRPGASYPGAGKFGSYGGLTCILAPELSRPAIVDALRKRHFYATTGNRPLLYVSLLSENKEIARLGDILEADGEGLCLNVELSGTGPIEAVEVWNGTTLIHRHAPAAINECGRRFKVVWGGAECKGRARMTPWDGSLTLSGNRIQAVTPINFHNANRPLKSDGDCSLSWRSNTTGGESGFILELETASTGSVAFETEQVCGSYDLQTPRLEPVRWDCGGIEKRLEIRPLPDDPCPDIISFQPEIDTLKAGDNPLYVKVVQEDGHMAWSSPIYLIKES